MYPSFCPGSLPLWCKYCHSNHLDAEGLDADSFDGKDTPSEPKKSKTSTHNHEDKDKEVYKDDFVSAFVPHHNHGSVDYTSIADGHVHQCLDVTYPPTPSPDGTHIHYTEGYVLFEDGHNHHYEAWSGPAIPVGNGMHVHHYDFYTTIDDGHRHHVTGVDMPAPGNL